jgi:hypothetical protein
VNANARTAVTFARSPGQASAAVEGRKLLGGIGPRPALLHLVMDGAYEDSQTLQLALDLGFIPVVPPRPNRGHSQGPASALHPKPSTRSQESVRLPH